MKLVLQITAGIVLGAVVLLIGCGALISSSVDDLTSSVEESGLADYGEKDRPISKAEYDSVKTGDRITTVTQRFGEPAAIVHGAEIARGEPDVYAWKQEGGGLLDQYTFDVDTATGKIIAKALF